MKFFNFVELGSCCRPQATPAPEEGGGRASGGQAPPPSKRRGRLSASAAAQWRPGLPAISEDSVVGAVHVEGKGNPTARRRPPSKVVRSTSKSRSFYNSSGGSKDESSANSIPVIVPAFSPTSLVF